MRSIINIHERLVVRDNAGIVRERLVGNVLPQLNRWFLDPEGGDSGGLLLAVTPLLDTSLERLVQVGEAPRATDRSDAMRMFGAGLMVGAALLAPELTASPFPPRMTTDEATSLLEAEPERLAPVLDADRTQFITDPGVLAVELMAEDRALDHVIYGCYRMAMAGRRPYDTGPMRLLFYAGMLGAGLRGPASIENAEEAA